jgi:glycine/D-amino acid oxidase-like deaminating enzyme
MADSRDLKVCVVGGGIIGASIAYYLSKRGVRCVLIEKTQIASAASGKSGGFLARVISFIDLSPHSM